MMNRIILIGNGFDLAHGLRTSYADFIDYYWEDWGKRLQGSYLGDDLTDKLCTISQKGESLPWFWRFPSMDLQQRKRFLLKKLLRWLKIARTYLQSKKVLFLRI